MEQVLIIGAGTAGLGLAFELKRRGVTPAIIDRAGRVAESWRRRHPQLRLNTSARTSYQPGMKIPRALGTFPHRDDYIRYLEQYHASLGIPVRFGISAERIHRDAEGWWIATSAGPVAARQVVVCTGPENVPVWPSWPGMEAFRGQLVHAADFGDASEFAGRKVLIVGAGNSGVDVGSSLAGVDMAAAWISVRSGATIVPRRVLGIPAQEMLVAVRWTPLAFQDACTEFISRLSFGDLSRYGIPRPPGGPISRFLFEGVAVALDDGFVRALKKGMFHALPEVQSLGADGVRLADGRVVDPDVIICATGYRPGLEKLAGHLDVLDGKGRPRTDRRTGRSPLAGLWFFGLTPAPYGNMYLRRREAGPLARRIVKALK